MKLRQGRRRDGPVFSVRFGWSPEPIAAASCLVACTLLDEDVPELAFFDQLHPAGRTDSLLSRVAAVQDQRRTGVEARFVGAQVHRRRDELKSIAPPASQATTVAPSFANASASTAPQPRAVPVIRTTLSANEPVLISVAIQRR
jgi:hypothetical protein